MISAITIRQKAGKLIGRAKYAGYYPPSAAQLAEGGAKAYVTSAGPNRLESRHQQVICVNQAF